MQSTLALNAALGIVTAVLYAVVGYLFAKRATTSEDALKARRSFTVWWYALAITSGLGSFQQLLAGFGVVTLPLYVALSYLLIPILMLALAGLLQYLLYIHTGSHRWRTPILVAHALVGISYFVIIAWLRPESIRVTDWNATVKYAVDPLPGWFQLYAIATIIVPVLLASLAYLTLAFRTRVRLARFRILTVSGSFVLWFGSSLLASIVGWSKPVEDGGWYWWPLASRAIALFATLVLIFAFRPPRGLEKRLREADENGTLGGPGGVGSIRLAYARRVTTRPARSA